MAAPEVWGPAAWNCIHGASEEADEPSFILLINCLQFALPCPDCREHLKKYCNDTSWSTVPLGTKHLRVKWVWELHNLVNSRLGRKSLPFDIYKRRVNAFGSRPKKEEVFCFVLVCCTYTKDVSLALCLAACFKCAPFSKWLDTATPESNTMFEHVAQQWRLMCIAEQQPLQTLGEMRHCVALTDALAPPRRPDSSS